MIARRAPAFLAGHEPPGPILVEDLGTEFAKLLEDIPELCWRKFGAGTPNTPAGRAHLEAALVNKHSGELVELDRRFGGWQLRAERPGDASVELPAGDIAQWW